MGTSRQGRVAERAIQPPAAESVSQALEMILGHITRLSAEDVPLDGAAGRVLAADVTAPTDLWPFSRAAMDGYAVRAEDGAQASSHRPISLRVVGEAFAGATPGPGITQGTAVRIATGAQIPEGSDAVIPYEQVQASEDVIVVSSAVPAGKHIFRAGEDARRGETILAAGSILRGGNLALLASLGIGRVSVVRRVRVAILTVGDELVETDVVPGPGQVRESNSHALAAEVQALGGTPWRLGIARDDLDDVIQALRRGLEADALIVCAGMSVGERDLVKEALTRVGVRLVFWRVPMKPGAPAAFGLAGETPVFGLPGTPGAAMVAFEELVRPALLAMMGHRNIHRPLLRARLSAPVRVPPGRRRYLWSRVTVRWGDLVAECLTGQSTATLRSVSDANALLVVPPDFREGPAGSRMDVQLLADPEPSTAPHVPVVAIVGWSGAGKTTLIERLVPVLQARGYAVATVKHSDHPLSASPHETDKDTGRHERAGAEATVLIGPRQATITCGSGEALSLGAAVELLAAARPIDMVLVEGFHQARVPKIEVAADPAELRCPPEELLAVVSPVAGQADIPWFRPSDVDAITDLIVSRVVDPAKRLL